MDGRRQTLTFGVSGLLYRNGLVMYDRETGSLWSHVTGRAIDGPLRSSELVFISVLHTTWGGWRKAHPGSRLLDGPRGPDAYAEYYRSARTGIRPVGHQDRRLLAKARVLGVYGPGHARAYPLAVLATRGMVQERFGGMSLLVAWAPEGDTAVAYDAGSDRFRLRDGRLEDEATHSAWHPLSGEAIAGPRKGDRLARVPQTLAFWFAWRDYFPDTELLAP